jgi:uncharacterized protein
MWRRFHFRLVVCVACLGSAAAVPADEPLRIKVLFLGDQGHHRPADRYRQIQPLLARHGIDITYTEKVGDVNSRVLAEFDALLLYANIDRIERDQAKALLDYVAAGHGFVPLHCASYCFRNSPEIVALIGAQFQRHGTGVFRETVARADHPLMQGYGGFESWDESYVHQSHNEKDREVLSYRVDAEGREPWTWIRRHGKGRVFYTAWGHDQRTWGNPGFQNLLLRGIRWAVNREPAAAGPFPPLVAEVPDGPPQRDDMKPFEYVEAKIPFYPAGERWGTLGEPITKMQKPLDPAESMKHLITPVGFEVQLFAAEPDIVKPITMNWDERGRLWIAETYDYPNELQPEGKGRDRIKICEDTDGDGRADKFTVFADKLSIPTSITFARGGVIVMQAPDTLFLQDTDGDDKADVRKVLFTGWSTRDTHAGPSNLQYGLDGWIYGMVGYAGFYGEVGGERHRFSQGFFRFLPDGSKLEFLRSTNNNTWGLGFSEEGIVFGSTANRNPSEYLPIANRYYEGVRGWSASQLNGIADTFLFHSPTEKVRQVDQHGGYTAAAGHALYTAREYPREYWNRAAFVTDGTGHLVGTFAITADGADFHSTNPFNMLGSDDEWTAPIMAEVGPDGHVWVIDWYNFIVQHNPTPAGFQTGKGGAYETELRDKRYGRIYRVVYRAAAAPGHFSLADAAPVELIETLRHKNSFWRKHAQRLLIERGEKDVVPLLVELVRDTDVDEIGLNTAAIHALWALKGLDALDGKNRLPLSPGEGRGEGTSDSLAAAVAALKHPSAGVRRNAVTVLPSTSESAQAILDAGVLSDSDAQVRLAALLAISTAPPTAGAGKEVAVMLARSENIFDKWLPDAATAAAAKNDLGFLQAVLANSGANAEKFLTVVGIVAEHYARSEPADTVGALLAHLDGADPRVAETVIGAFAKGWPKGKPVDLSDEAQTALLQLLPRLPIGSQSQLVRLATAWGTEKFQKYADDIVQSLAAAAADDKKADDERISASRQLIEFRSGDSDVIQSLMDIVVSPRTSPDVSAGVIDALAASESSEVGAVLISKFAALTPTAKKAAVRILLGRPALTRAFLDGLADGKLQLADLSLDQKQALASHPNREIARRAKEILSRDAGLPSPDRQKVLEELMPLAKTSGDAVAGKEVFKQQCAKCHMHSGEGNKIGPDLTGMAVHPKAELLTHIIDPSRNVEGNYRVYTVLLDDGRVLTGLLAGETKTSIELIDAEAKRHAILRENIEELVASTKSLMPEGFEKQVPPEAVANLLEFLTKRGQFTPLDLRRVATIVTTQGMFYSKEAAVERLIFPDWSPKTFEGVPFQLIDPQGDRVANAVMLYGPTGKFPPTMPRSVNLLCNAPSKAIHFLSGVSGWGAQGELKGGSVSMIVRLHYADGTTEDHPLRNGEHFADYIGRFEVPKSKLAFMLRNQQIRYFAIHPERRDVIEQIELVKGPDHTAPVVMAVTAESL